MRSFSLTTPLHFIWNGIFSSPGPDWMHISRELHEYELMIVLSGTLYIGDEWGEYEVQEGEYILMAPTKRQYGSKPSLCTFQWFHFVYSPLDSKIHLSLPDFGPVRDLSRICTMINQLCYMRQHSYSEQTCSYGFTTMLLELSEQFQGSNSAESGRISLQKEELVRQIRAYIRFNTLATIRITDIAAHFGYHEKYISAVFKSVSGQGLKDYLIAQKMELAKDMLLNSHYTISQIAQTLGFSDVHNFSHGFKKALGISPREFRNAFYVDYT